MFCFLFAVVLFRSHCVRGQHQRLIQGDHGLKRSIFQQGLSYANFVAHKFQFLQGSMLDSSCEVNRATECGFACVANAPCVSFNVALSPNENGKLRCELLTEDKFTSPDKLTDSQQFHHYSIKVTDNLKPSSISHLATIARVCFSNNPGYSGLVSFFFFVQKRRRRKVKEKIIINLI